MEVSEGNLACMLQDERCELFELDIAIGVRINSEHVPEDILKISLAVLVQYLHNQQLKFSLCKKFALDIMAVEGSQFRPY